MLCNITRNLDHNSCMRKDVLYIFDSVFTSIQVFKRLDLNLLKKYSFQHNGRIPGNPFSFVWCFGWEF